MKKKYLISYTGLFESGYVILKLTGESGKRVHFDGFQDAKNAATKFRFKWWVDFVCYMLNRNSIVNFDFITFEVVKTDADKLQ